MFLSFIIPVYNTEDYIEECLNSLLNQNISSDEYEIICINDGSKDKTVEELCIEFASQISEEYEKNGEILRISPFLFITIVLTAMVSYCISLFPTGSR